MPVGRLDSGLLNDAPGAAFSQARGIRARSATDDFHSFTLERFLVNDLPLAYPATPYPYI